MNPAITLWSKPSCVQCTATERYLSEAGVQFVKLDLTAPENASQLAWFKSQGFLSAPVTEYNGRLVPGFNPGLLAEIVAEYRADRQEAA